MANTGPDSNNSNFMILTEPAPWLDGKNVAFGEVKTACLATASLCRGTIDYNPGPNPHPGPNPDPNPILTPPLAPP